VRRGDDWARSSRVTNNVTGNTTRVTRGSDGGTAVTRRGPGDTGGMIGQTGSGDVYAGRDGNVYRKQGDSWQKYENGSWSGVPEATPQQREQAAARAQDRASQSGTSGATRADPATMGQLNRDSTSRSDGAQRTRDASTMRTAPSGGYRPSGGMRGGGRRR
jgi:hypothetical protein